MKLYVNMAPTLLYGGNTGIQRVVRELERHLDKQTVAGHDYEFGGLFGGRWLPAADFRLLNQNLGISKPPLREAIKRYIPRTVRILGRRLLNRALSAQSIGMTLPPGSYVLDIDAGWIDDWKTNYNLNLKRISLIYDLIPCSHPQFCTPDHSENFNYWLNEVVNASDSVISISKSAMDAVKDFSDNRPHSRVKSYEYFHLGCDFEVPRTNIDQSLPKGTSSKCYFLVVGTLEPRKNHLTVFRAFNSYRKNGGRWNLIVVGRAGWNCEDIISEMTNSPYWGEGLQWLNNIDDPTLSFIYQNAGTLIIPSYIEGFGLPLIEGAHWGCPVIASDIPVFREIGEEFANFFSPSDTEHLKRRMLEAENGLLEKRLELEKIKTMSWQESSRQFANKIGNLIERN